MFGVKRVFVVTTQTFLLDYTAWNSDASTNWWMKGNGCDIVPGLCESVQHKWSGDVDLIDGKLQAAYQIYLSGLQFVSTTGLGCRRAPVVIRDDLQEIHKQLLIDKDFAIEGNIMYVWLQCDYLCLHVLQCSKVPNVNTSANHIPSHSSQLGGR